MTKVIFLGTPEFSATVLKGLLKEGYDVIAAVTQPDKPVGRKQKLQKSPVKLIAEEENIKLYQPAKLPGSPEVEELKALQADLIITAAYGQFLPTSFLNSAKVAAINVHGSLLPKYRGGAPIQWSLLNGDKETGITIMYMVKGMDAGDIISQEKLPIERDDDNGSLFEKLAIVGRELLLDTIPKILSGDIQPIQQDPDKVVFSPNISKEQEHIDFTQPAETVFNQIRALSPDPGAWMMLNGQRTKLYKTEVEEINSDLPVGSVYDLGKKRLVIVAGDGQGVSIKKIQPAGKKIMDIANYMNGLGKDLEKGQQVIDEK
ncbi:methionyl-tRNA formyltransferase [Companilactobacillus bobalius]|uniref:Methionyl-tRNA formyltransferase n=2 Tax=Companilactobacillus bobalius TaxID=2801451 RepID=A0A202F730_9LACO|nr:methionyl-tRNA formyltransferase [Companilactobacillus bobalius]KAE9558403.1 methionyl-tRNA formyltransferase [Companilactobacillus bobalius]KRK83675.1 methionyl-tRNA formyltransferase [Companilactobacillus bobalius DSM 19674]OVE96230.1 Methionyl-tRNA formyltransferase [Companilactobacillus bobalius]GEO58089.1 methionyl-tRNA formyltransferase [Companilactobacillus paralimentarius]